MPIRVPQRPTTVQARRVIVEAGAPVLGPTRIAIDAQGRIEAVIAIEEAALSSQEAGTIVMPALSDAHDHGRGVPTLAIGAPDQPLATWMVDLARQPRIDPYLNAVVALGRLAESGVAAVNHCHNTQASASLLDEAAAVSRAARDVGIAVGFGWPFFDRNPIVYGPVEEWGAHLPPSVRERLAGNEAALRSCDTNLALMAQAAALEHSLFTLQYHPVGPQWVQPATLERIAARSADEGRRVHLHLLETEGQRRWADRAYPQGLLTYLDDIGLLSPRLTVAHAVWLRPDECALLARRGVTVSINISSNLRLSSGQPPVAELVRAGVPIAVGLDGMALDDDQDMLRELRLVGLIAARDDARAPVLTHTALLDGCWRVGRRSVLGDNGGGRIAVGMPADLLALDFDRLASDCLMDEPEPIGLILGRAGSRDVQRLIVGGAEIVSGGRCASIDLPDLEASLTRDARSAFAVMPIDAESIETLKRDVELYYTVIECCQDNVADAASRRVNEG